MPSIRARRARRTLITLGACLVLTTPMAHAQSSFGPGITPPAQDISERITPPTQDISERITPPAAAPGADTAMSQVIADIHTHTNRERTERGLGPLRRDHALERIAQDWSTQMAAEDRMRHNPRISALMNERFPGRWTVWGENVLQNWSGRTGADLVQQWMNSPTHRANLLNPAHNTLGVGAAVAPGGKLYATQNLARLR